MDKTSGGPLELPAAVKTFTVSFQLANKLEPIIYDEVYSVDWQPDWVKVYTLQGWAKVRRLYIDAYQETNPE